MKKENPGSQMSKEKLSLAKVLHEEERIVRRFEDKNALTKSRVRARQALEYKDLMLSDATGVQGVQIAPSVCGDDARRSDGRKSC